MIWRESIETNTKALKILHQVQQTQTRKFFLEWGVKVVHRRIIVSSVHSIPLFSLLTLIADWSRAEEEEENLDLVLLQGRRDSQTSCPCNEDKRQAVEVFVSRCVSLADAAQSSLLSTSFSRWLETATAMRRNRQIVRRVRLLASLLSPPSHLCLRRHTHAWRCSLQLARGRCGGTSTRTIAGS